MDIQEPSKAFRGDVVGEALPGPVVEAGCNIHEVPGCVNGQVRVFEKILAQQPIGMFIRTALPRLEQFRPDLLHPHGHGYCDRLRAEPEGVPSWVTFRLERSTLKSRRRWLDPILARTPRGRRCFSG